MSAPLCPTCHEPAPAGASFCPKDGTALVTLVPDQPLGSNHPTVREMEPSRAEAFDTGPTRQRLRSVEGVGADVESSGETIQDEVLAPEVDLIGRKLGEYVVQRKIGSGGMGIVYEGLQPVIGRKVAIKVLRSDLSAEEARRDLATEARAANAIRHRGIIDVFGFGEIPRVGQYMVMEYLDGQPLDAVIKSRGPFSPQQAIAWIDGMLGALGAAHSSGVIHRDLKPSNIFLVTEPDGVELVKVLDFGLAKLRNPDGKAPQTMAGFTVGTPEYMSPEQARGRPLDARSDLYAVGLLLYELLAGVTPFRGPQAEVVIKQVTEEPLPPSTHRTGIPPRLEALVMALLRKNPDDRPASAEAVRAELKEISSELARAPLALTGLVERAPVAGEALPGAPAALDPHATREVVRPPSPPAAKASAPAAIVPLALTRIVERTPVALEAAASVPAAIDPHATREVVRPPSSPPAKATPGGVRWAAAAVALVLLGVGGVFALRHASARVAPLVAPFPPERAEAPAPASVSLTGRGEVSSAGALAGSPTGPAANATPGILKVVLADGTATAKVDGVERGRVRLPLYVELSPGPHLLELVGPRREAYRANVEVRAGETTVHEATLPAEP